MKIKTTFTSFTESLNNFDIKLFTKNFNRAIKDEYRIISMEYANVSDINEYISRKFIGEYIVLSLNTEAYDIILKNSVKKPKNNFQYEVYLNDGNILWISFIYVDDNGVVDIDRSNIELLNSDYDLIEKIV